MAIFVCETNSSEKIIGIVPITIIPRSMDLLFAIKGNEYNGLYIIYFKVLNRNPLGGLKSIVEHYSFFFCFKKYRVHNRVEIKN